MKKQSIAIILLAFLFIWGQSSTGQSVSYQDSWGERGFSIQEESTSKIVINYSLTDFSMVDVNIDGELTKSITVPGIFLPNDEGAPDLAGTGRYIAIPQGAEAVLNIKAVRKEVIQNVDVAPAPAIPFDNDPSPLKYTKDEKIYSANQYYPLEPVVLSEKSKIRGVDVVMLGITPFQYNPVTKELIIYRDLIVELSFKGGNDTFGEERLRSRWWDPMMANAILNFNTLPLIDYNWMYEDNLEDTDGCEYLIITPDGADFVNSANDIADFRNKQGILTNVVTLTDVGGNSTSAIETYVNNAYNNWTIAPTAVLLLGDFGSSITNNVIAPIYNNYCASDNIYADVDGDHLPDIIFARITANDASQLNVMVSKFINYETYPPTNTDFYNNPITAIGWQTERWFQICGETVGGFWKNELGKNPVRINAIYSGTPGSSWSSAPNTSTVVNHFGPDSLGYIPAAPGPMGGWTGGNATMINNTINNGSFMILHRDHGNVTLWGEPYYTNSSVDGLNNQDLTFVMSINCLTGKYNSSGECLTEKFHRHTSGGNNAGALGVTGASESSYSFVNDTYVWGFIDNMWPDFMPAYGTEFPTDYIMPAFGNAAGKYFLQQSGWPYNTSSKTVTYHLFHHHGGAFLTLYTEFPSTLSVSHASSIFNTATSIDVTADDGSFIAVTTVDGILGTANGTGSVVNIPITAQAAGTSIYVTVTKQNYYRYEATVDVIGDGVLAEFSADNTTICEGETVTFTDQSVGSITSWNWTFGDGSIGTGQNVSHVYADDGVYDVSLLVSDGTNTDTEIKTEYITVQTITADFSGTPTTVIVGNSVTFTDLSICNATSWSWDFPGGTPPDSDEQNPTVTYSTINTYDVSLTVGNLSGNYDTKTLTDYITVTDIQYCESHGNATSEWIAGVDIAGQINSSGSSGTVGYEDFTGVTYNLNPDNSYPIILTPGFSPRSKFEYWTVWIDFNNNGDFTDAGELVLSVPKKKTAVSGTLSIPASASGTTTMRIAMKRSAYATPCEIFDLGEVEDYTVAFVPPTPQPPVAEFTADKRTVAVGGTVNFTDQSLNIPTTWAWTFGGGTPANSTVQDPLVTYNTAGTFDVKLVATNAQGSDDITKTSYITVSDNPIPPYCVPVASNTADFINSITIGTTTHNSGQGVSGYEYYTTPYFTFTPGSTYPVTLEPFDAKNKNFWRIWIDFNNDNAFDGSNETVLIANNKKGIYEGSITIPTGVEAVSPDRMRITMKTGSSPAACETGFNGEVEDYDVYYGGDGDVFISSDDQLELHIYPNPAENILNIIVSGNRENVLVNIYNSLGNLMQSFHMDKRHEQINLESFNQGMYFIHVNDGNKMILKKFIVN